jgi:hypothetical protein
MFIHLIEYILDIVTFLRYLNFKKTYLFYFVVNVRVKNKATFFNLTARVK